MSEDMKARRVDLDALDRAEIYREAIITPEVLAALLDQAEQLGMAVHKIGFVQREALAEEIIAAFAHGVLGKERRHPPYMFPAVS